MELKEIGEIIRNERKRIGMTQQELAELVGYSSKVAICRIEAGQIRITMDKMAEIAAALRIPISVFFDTYERKSSSDPKVIASRPDPLFAAMSGLDEEDMERVIQYIKILKESKLWQARNGTQNGDDGSSASARTEK